MASISELCFLRCSREGAAGTRRIDFLGATGFFRMTGFFRANGIREMPATRRDNGLGGKVDLSPCNGRGSSFIEAFT